MKQRLSSAPFRCLILGMACTAVSVSVRASNADTMHDISSEFASLRNARDEIQYRHQAEADDRQAHCDLKRVCQEFCVNRFNKQHRIAA